MTIDSPLRALRPVAATYECTRHNAGQLVAQGARCCRGGNPDALHAQGEYVKGAGIGSNGTRSRLKALEFLLSVGADPNAKPNASLGDVMPDSMSDRGQFLSAPVLFLAVMIRDSQLAKSVLELLLMHKADHKLIYDGKSLMETAPTPGIKMTLKALIKRYQDQPRPVCLCPCGSALPFAACHGHKSGVPVHPRALCPCKTGDNLQYGQCCLKAGKALRETIPPCAMPSVGAAN